MALFNVLFDIAAKTTSFESSLAGIERQFNSLKNLASDVGQAMGAAFTGGGLVHFIDQAIDGADAMKRAAEEAGESTELFSALAYAAKGAGVDLEELSGGFKKMQVAIAGGGDSFAKIGVDLGKLKTQTPDQQFQSLAQAIAAIPDPAARAAAAVEIFGRSGTQLLPLIMKGAEGIAEAMQKAKDIGATTSDALADQLARVKQSFVDLGSTASGVWQHIAAGVGPVVATFADIVRQILGGATAAEKLQGEINLIKAAQGDAAQNGDLDQVAKYQAAIDKLQATKQAIEDSSDAINTSAYITQLAAQSTDKLAAAFKSMGSGVTGSWVEDAQRQMQELANSLDRVRDSNRSAMLQMNSDTQTSLEKTMSKWKDFDDQLQVLLDNGAISPEEAKARADAYSNALFATLEASVKKSDDKVDQMSDDSAKSIAQAYKTAGDSIKSTFASAMEGNVHTFDDFASQILKSLANLTASFATDKLFGALGDWGKSQSGSGGIAGGIGSFFGALFGGGKASGGPLEQGRWYIAGENGPEPIWGGGSGAFAAGYGNGSSSGGGAVSITMQVDARGATQDAIAMLPGAMKQASDNAVQRVQQLKRQGIL